LLQAGKNIVTGLFNGVKAIAGNLLQWFIDLPGFILGAIGDLTDTLYSAGKDIIQGLIDGIDSMLGPLDEIVGGVADTIGRFIPGSPVEKGPLKVLNRGHAGSEIVRMLMSGMMSEATSLARSASAIAGMTSSGLALPMGSVGSVGGDIIDIDITVENTTGDPEDIADAITDSGILTDIITAVKAGRR
jgi:hypothetical protein